MSIAYSNLQLPPHNFHLSEGMYLDIHTAGESIAKVSEADWTAAMLAGSSGVEGLARRIAVYCRPALTADDRTALTAWLTHWRVDHYS